MSIALEGFFYLTAHKGLSITHLSTPFRDQLKCAYGNNFLRGTSLFETAGYKNQMVEFTSLYSTLVRNDSLSNLNFRSNLSG